MCAPSKTPRAPAGTASLRVRLSADKARALRYNTFAQFR